MSAVNEVPTRLLWRVIRRAVLSWWTVGRGAASIAGVFALPTTVVLGRAAVVAALLLVILVAAVAISAVREISTVASREPARLDYYALLLYRVLDFEGTRLAPFTWQL